MICQACAIEHHADCENVLKGRWDERGTWCDCQHRQSAIHADSIVNRSQPGREPQTSKGDGQAEATEEKESKDKG